MNAHKEVFRFSSLPLRDKLKAVPLVGGKLDDFISHFLSIAMECQRTEDLDFKNLITSKLLKSITPFSQEAIRHYLIEVHGADPEQFSQPCNLPGSGTNDDNISTSKVDVGKDLECDIDEIQE